MKFQSVRSLYQHLKEAKPHFSLAYLVITNDDADREELISQIISCFPHERERINEPAALFTAMGHNDIFQEEKLLYVDDLSQFSKEPLIKLGKELKHLMKCRLIMGAKNSSSIKPLLQEGMRELIILDLSLEKPWDKQNRLIEQLMRRASKKQKILSKEIATTLYHNTLGNYALMKQELQKLITYTDDRKTIEKNDLNKLCTSLNNENHWKIIDMWIKSNEIKTVTINEMSDLLSFLGQLRYQLNIGLKLKQNFEAKRSWPDICKNLNIAPKILEKKLSLFRPLSILFFKQSLLELYNIEQKAKQGYRRPQLLCDLLLGSLSQIRSTATLS